MKSLALLVVIGLDVQTVPTPLPDTPPDGSVGFESNGLAVFAPETPNAIREIAVGWDIVTVMVVPERELLAIAYHSSM